MNETGKKLEFIFSIYFKKKNYFSFSNYTRIELKMGSVGAFVK